MVKTLKDEIVEALRDAAPYLDEKSEAAINKLATKVESARCENCLYHIEQLHGEWTDGCGKGGVIINGQGPVFGCWHFEPKENK